MLVCMMLLVLNHVLDCDNNRGCPYVLLIRSHHSSLHNNRTPNHKIRSQTLYRLSFRLDIVTSHYLLSGEHLMYDSTRVLIENEQFLDALGLLITWLLNCLAHNTLQHIEKVLEPKGTERNVAKKVGSI